MGFKIPIIAKMLGTSSSTVKRRMRQCDLKSQYHYSALTDEELDEAILCHLNNFPNTGYKRMKGFLLTSGIKVQEHRVRESMRRVDPCLLYTSPSPRDKRQSRMPSSA